MPTRRIACIISPNSPYELAPTVNNDKEIFSHYRNAEDLEEVDSALYRLLLALIEHRISSEELVGYFNSHIFGSAGRRDS